MFKKMKVALLAATVMSDTELLKGYLEAYSKQTGIDLESTDYTSFDDEKEKFKAWLMKTLEENL